MKALIAALIVGAATLSSPAFAGPSNEQIDQTNFLVNRGCSGTLIDTQRQLVLTAYHCIATQYDYVEKETISSDGTVKKEKVRVARPGTVSQIFYKGPAEVQRNSYIYKIEASDNTIDLALLKVEARLPDYKASPMACADVKRLDPVYAVGNSYSVLYSSVTKGIVSSMTRSYRDLGLVGDLGDHASTGENGFVQHSAVIAGGNSGGAMYNEAGELAGVNVRGAATGFSFAVPLADIQKFLRMQDLGRLWNHCEKVNG